MRVEVINMAWYLWVLAAIEYAGIVVYFWRCRH